ncbi:hypothetical protein RND81_10G052200 [Saponaria officinalis]|uniref:Uncharacterized protein n=1 Tax=Saponaria officinalis TaxID=3572 RepID=A0AAW1I0J5_SAPOF
MASLYFPQYQHELFYKYFNRLHEYVIRSPYPYQTWELCHVLYNGLNEETVGHVYALSDRRFIDDLSYEEKWELFQYVAYDTEQWELANSRRRRPHKKPTETLNSQSNSSMSTEEMIRTLITTQMSLMTSEQETRDSIQNLLSRVTQMAEAVTRLEARDEFNPNSGEFVARYDSEFNEPSSLRPDESHSYKECEVDNDDDDDDDGFWDEDEDCGSNFYPPYQPVYTPEIPTDIHVEHTHVGNNCSFNGDLSDHSFFEDPLSVLVEDVQEGVAFAACKVENNMLDGPNDVRDKLLMSRDLGNHTPRFEDFMTIPLEKENLSHDFKENKIVKDEKDDINFFELNSTKAPLIPPLHEPYELVSQKLHPSPYMIVPITKLTFKEEYMDTKYLFEHSRAEIQWLHTLTSSIYMWCQMVCIAYDHFSNMCASVFDKLLRALSCSALKLTLG